VFAVSLLYMLLKENKKKHKNNKRRGYGPQNQRKQYKKKIIKKTLNCITNHRPRKNSSCVIVSSKPRETRYSFARF